MTQRVTATALAILCLTLALPAYAATHRSADLGWQAGQDVTEALDKLLADGTLKAGDELVLDQTYKICGSRELPDNFILSAVEGAGFDVTDAVKPKQGGRPLLELGNRNTLRNLTITYLDTPPLGPTGEKHEVHFTRRLGIQARGKSDLMIENCRLTGSIGHHLKLSDCSNVKVIGTHIAGGHWSVFVLSGENLTFWRCLIEKCQGDGIKTGNAGNKAVWNVLVDNCVFQDNLRDGIDTTGGFNDSVVRNTIFRRLHVSGIDLKAHYQARTETLGDIEPENVGILVENCLFQDMPNGLVLTTLDGGRRKGPGHELLTPANIKAYAAHDIAINNCAFGYVETPLKPTGEGGYGVNYPSDEGEHMRAIYVKDAHSIRYRNARLFGDRIRALYVRSIGGSRSLSKEAAEAIEPNITGNVLDAPVPSITPGMTEAPFHCGPRPMRN